MSFVKIFALFPYFTSIWALFLLRKTPMVLECSEVLSSVLPGLAEPAVALRIYIPVPTKVSLALLRIFQGTKSFIALELANNSGLQA